MDLFGIYKTDDQLITEQVNSIDGLEYYPRFITREEEIKLVETIDSKEWLSDLKRKVQHYGYKYDYRARRIDKSFRIGTLPTWSKFVIDRIIKNGIIDNGPDQLIINNYEVGQGISPHVDCEPCFSDTIVSLSLFSDVVIDFKHLKSTKKESILLQRRSLLVMSGEARYNYEHGIAPRINDVFNNKKRQRERRISLTFRKVVLT